MKLNQMERNEYRDLKTDFKAKGGKFVLGYACGRAVTLAVIRSGKFYHVAAAVQGRGDKANKRRGRYEALCRLYNDCYIPVPAFSPFQFGTISGLDLDMAFGNADLNG